MNPRERLMLIRLVTRLVQQPEVVKDADAALEVEALLKARPDAPYLLMQRTLMLEAALEDARLQSEQTAAPFQRDVPDAASRYGQAALTPSFAAQAPLSPPKTASGAGSFLQNAASIGAGVLGGSLLFQGIESLLDGRGNGYSSGSAQMPLEIFETQNIFHGAPPPSREVETLFASSQGSADDDLLDLDAGDGSWL